MVWRKRPAASRQNQLLWVDGTGATTDVVTPEPLAFALSPDGGRVATAEWAAGDRVGNVWLLDFTRPDLKRRLASMPNRSARNPQWSPDGEALFALSVSFAREQGQLIRMTTAGTAPPEEMRASASTLLEATFTADGRQAVVTRMNFQEGERQLVVFDTSGDDAGRLYLPSLTNGFTPRLSPDGRLLAFKSDDGGNQVLSVDRFPESTGPTPVAVDVFSHYWSQDSRRLFYIKGGQLMEVSIAAGGGPVIGQPRMITNLPDGTTECQPAPNGRFLCMARVPDETAPVINVWVNRFGGGGSR
jgi:Tol biopolymer transport system component